MILDMSGVEKIKLSLNYNLLKTIYSHIEYLHGQDETRSPNYPLLYKVREFINNCDENNDLTLDGWQFLSIVSWANEIKNYGKKEKQCFDNLYFLMLVHAKECVEWFNAEIIKNPIDNRKK